MSKLPISTPEYNILHEELKKKNQERVALGKKIGELMSTSGSFAVKTPGYMETENSVKVVEEKIRQMENILNTTALINSVEDLPKEQVGVYSKIICQDQNGIIRKYYICHLESDNIMDFQIVSPKSPIGRGLMGRCCGETVEITTPRSAVKLTIVSQEIFI
jgi:transcription elongation GreA/GreB family factor